MLSERCCFGFGNVDELCSSSEQETGEGIARANGNWAGEEGVEREEVNKNVTSNPHISTKA